MQEESEEIITLNQAIGLIRKSVGDEKEDEMFYDILIKQAPTEKEKEIIKSIRNDERKHNQILRKLYYEFTGQVLPSDTLISESNNTMDYKANLEKALFGELDAVSKYRKIMGTMPSGDSYTLLMSIMTDELRHASKYNFLINNAK
jgi:rubrerythrin